MACVYALVSTRDKSEIRYIGATKGETPTSRLTMHLWHASRPSTPLHEWLQDETAAGYSIEALTLESALTFKESRKTERIVIAMLKDSCSLFNKTGGGEGSLGWVPSDETRRKIGDANRGNSHPHTEEFKQRQRERFSGDGNPSKREDVRQKISASLTGRPGHKHTEETKQHLREVLKGVNAGRKLSDEHKQKLSKAGTGRKHSEEVKRQISESNKGQKRSEEARAKMSAARSGRKLSDAHRQAIADGLRRRRENP
jgi:hypothetical protein